MCKNRYYTYDNPAVGFIVMLNLTSECWVAYLNQLQLSVLKMLNILKRRSAVGLFIILIRTAALNIIKRLLLIIAAVTYCCQKRTKPLIKSTLSPCLETVSSLIY